MLVLHTLFVPVKAYSQNFSASSVAVISTVESSLVRASVARSSVHVDETRTIGPIRCPISSVRTLSMRARRSVSEPSTSSAYRQSCMGFWSLGCTVPCGIRTERRTNHQIPGRMMSRSPPSILEFHLRMSEDGLCGFVNLGLGIFINIHRVSHSIWQEWLTCVVMHRLHKGFPT
jgi:hypothetical protein